MQPNLVIYRHNSLDHSFVELRYLNSVLLSIGDLVRGFPYPELKDSEIVLSRITEDGSVEIKRFDIGEKVHALCHDYLSKIVKNLVASITPPNSNNAVKPPTEFASTLPDQKLVVPVF